MNQELKDKALAVIEYLAEASDLMGKNDEINLIYQAAHVANGGCTQHEDWIDWLNEFYHELTASGECPTSEVTLDTPRTFQKLMDEIISEEKAGE